MKKKLSIVSAALAVTLASIAYAAPMYSLSYEYYADAEHSSTVGYGDFTCNGRWIYSGTKTPYYRELSREACRITIDWPGPLNPWP